MKKITYKSLETKPLIIEHVSSCIDLWVTQFNKANESLQCLPVQWGEDTSLLQSFLEKNIEKNQGIAAYSNGDLVGYMTYGQFSFHGEETIVSPIIGHASVPQSRSKIYREMYRKLAGKWVADGALNHIIGSYTSDKALIEALFQLGFGVYVVDAFRDNTPIPTNGNTPIREAKPSDLAEVKRLSEEFRAYFLQSPVFLVTKQENDEYFESILNDKNGTTFVTESKDGLTGLLYIRENDKSDVYSLAAKGLGKIDKLGAYMEESARGSGAGLDLLNAAIDWCRKREIDFIHVDFESANLFANGFWTKHFTPSIYSLKRRVNQDILKK